MRTSRLLPVILGMVLSCTVELAFAQAATVFSMTGTAQAVPNVGAPRTLRMGDSVNQGDTIATGAMSTAVLQFADGHVVAVVQDSRMTITKYVFDQSDASKGQIVLNLPEGGMRAVTGAIGKANPGGVKYMAGEAAIDVQGTDVTIVIFGVIQVAVVVNQGVVTFTLRGESVSLPAGLGTNVGPDGRFSSKPAAEVIAALRAQASASALVIAAFLGTASSNDIVAAINQAARNASGTNVNQQTRTTGTPSTTGNAGSSGSSGSGGGSASGRQSQES